MYLLPWPFGSSILMRVKTNNRILNLSSNRVDHGRPRSTMVGETNSALEQFISVHIIFAASYDLVYMHHFPLRFWLKRKLSVLPRLGRNNLCVCASPWERKDLVELRHVNPKLLTAVASLDSTLNSSHPFAPAAVHLGQSTLLSA